MTDIAIRVENLGKRYRIGGKQEPYNTLRDTLVQTAGASIRALGSVFRGRDGEGGGSEDFIWALKDVSFEVKRGEVVGIIGRNGAGKSTLLKILTRITDPTEGYVAIHGRVGSLLEVGTGFHPELTGRENIYLNGAILGMTRAEIERKFDEIVDFSGVEKFIDTPVKRYSSGMQVRLAFSVAAHLEPEILLVDEVLAVGDAEFQKKCLGKMGDVAKEGRTVLFVSHNLRAIQSLCTNAIQLKAGQVVMCGDSQSVVAKYLSAVTRAASEVTWPEQEAPGNDEVKLISIRVRPRDGNWRGIYSSRENLYIELGFIANANDPALCIGFDLTSSEGVAILRSYQTDLPPEHWPPIRLGENRWRCTIPGGLLNAGVYCVCPRIGMHNMYWLVSLDAVAQFEVVLDHGVSPLWNSLDGRSRPGFVAPILSWNAEP